MRRLYLIFILFITSSFLPVLTLAQDDVAELTETVQFIGLDFEIDYPDGWITRTASPVTFIEEFENDSNNLDIGRPVEGIVITLDHRTIAFLESIGAEIVDRSPEEMVALNQQFFGWELTNLEEVQIFGVDALRAEVEDSSGVHLVYQGFLNDERAFLINVAAPDADTLADFMPTWDLMLASIRDESDDNQLPETIQFIGLDFEMDYPDGWTIRSDNPVTWLEEIENDSNNLDIGRPVEGVVITLDHRTVAFLESIGAEIVDRSPEEMVALNQQFFGWEMTNVEAVQIFGVNAMRAETQDNSGSHLVYQGFLDDDHAFLIDIVATDEDALAEFLPTWDLMLASIRHESSDDLLPNTTQIPYTDYVIDYPEGFTAIINDNELWIEQIENDSNNFDIGRPVEGILFGFMSAPVEFLNTLGLEVDEGTPEELMQFNIENFDWELTNIEETQVFGVDTLQANLQNITGAQLIYQGFLDEENVFLMGVVAPDEETLADFMPTWDLMLASIREGTMAEDSEESDLIPSVDIVPDDITLFSSYAEFTQYIDDIETASGDEATELVESLWDELTATGNIPLTIGDVVVFLYRGDAESVNWMGEFNQGQVEINKGAGERVGETDLWLSKASVPTNARFLYGVLIDDSQDPIFDPANTTTFPIMDFEASVITMPEFEATTFSVPRDNIDMGTLSETLLINSENMGYSINYQVYTPADYDSLDDLPSVYVLDGDAFADSDVAAYPTILDNMIADGLIEPVIAVFIDPRDPDDPETTRRENEYRENPDFARFVAEELVPAVDTDFKTDAVASSRLITGISFGGIGAGYIAVQHPEVFQNMALSSPSFWATEELLSLFEASGDVPFNIYMNWGIPDWDVGDLTPIAEDFEELGFNVETMIVAEGHNFMQWRDVSDETLIYFFGTD